MKTPRLLVIVMALFLAGTLQAQVAVNVNSISIVSSGSLVEVSEGTAETPNSSGVPVFSTGSGP